MVHKAEEERFHAHARAAAKRLEPCLKGRRLPLLIVAVDNHIDAREVHRALDFVGMVAEDNGQSSAARLAKRGENGFHKSEAGVGPEALVRSLAAGSAR